MISVYGFYVEFVDLNHHVAYYKYLKYCNYRVGECTQYNHQIVAIYVIADDNIYTYYEYKDTLTRNKSLIDKLLLSLLKRK